MTQQFARRVIVVGTDGLSGTMGSLFRDASSDRVPSVLPSTAIPRSQRSRCHVEGACAALRTAPAGANVRRIATVMTWSTGSLVAQTWKSSASVYVLVFVR